MLAMPCHRLSYFSLVFYKSWEKLAPTGTFLVNCNDILLLNVCCSETDGQAEVWWDVA